MPESKRVTRGKVSVENDFRDKLKKSIFAGDAQDIKEWIIFDFLIPKAKTMLSEMVDGALGMLFNGTAGGRGGTVIKSGNATYVSYSDYSKKKAAITSIPREKRRSDKVLNIGFSLKIDADRVLEEMGSYLDVYDLVRLSNYYEFVGPEFVEINSTDQKYGWTDLSGASVYQGSDGKWYINLPPLETLS